MRGLLINGLIAALALTGPALAADPVPPAVAKILAAKALPEDGQWVFGVESDTSIDYLRYPFIRTPTGASTVVFRVFVDPVDLDPGEMEVSLMGREANCKAGSMRALGIVGFDKDGKFLASAPALDTFETPAKETIDAAFLAVLCDATVKPAADELMSLGEAWDDGMDTILFADFNDLPLGGAAKPEPKP